MLVLIRGAGDLASGIAHRLFQCSSSPRLLGAYAYRACNWCADTGENCRKHRGRLVKVRAAHGS